MKKSQHVMLTALFLTAVSAAARGQDIVENGPGDLERDRDWERNDTGRRNSTYYNLNIREHRHGFLSLFHRHQQSPMNGGQSNTPRSAGFGNTLRTASS